jgi:dipeptidyl aminopeptidase/acylaminoacyl peptidase
VLRTRRASLFAVLVVGCLLAGAATIAIGLRARDSGEAASAGASDALPAARAAKRPTVVFRSTAHHGQVAIAPAGRSSTAPTLSSLRCDRVYFAAGRGLCLARGGFPVGARAQIFGPDLHVRHTVALTGIPSRARVSPDGRYGAVTLFVTGHAYDPGSFSTQTTIIDLSTGQKIADLERFTVLRGDEQVTAVDVNFWGVTFARDSDRFYATLATGGKTYLIRGSVRQRLARVIHENVECPSLSPDGTRIAYKKRTGSKGTPWHLTVLDLATMRETPLSEQRSVDDQAEWLDDGRVLYAVDGSVWAARADGTGGPRRYIVGANSPVAVRW